MKGYRVYRGNMGGKRYAEFGIRLNCCNPMIVRSVSNYELRTTNYELRTTNYELRTTNYELFTTLSAAKSREAGNYELTPHAYQSIPIR